MPAGRRRFLALAGCTLCGCSGAVHRLPGYTRDQLTAAGQEIAAADATTRHRVTDAEVLETLRRVRERLLQPATALCQEMRVGACRWQIRASRSREVNAYAAGSGLVVIQKGVLNFARNDAEVAFVVAHEIGHHAANHVRQGRRNAAVGRLLGQLLLPSIAVTIADIMRPRRTDSRREARAELGEELGRLTFSREQEREADYLAGIMLHRAGYSLQQARGFLLTLARDVKDREADELDAHFFDTHPSGPERIAAFDRAIAEITSSNGALPPRA